MDSPLPSYRLEILARTRYADCEIISVEVNSASKVWVPAWLVVPRHAWTRLLLVLSPNGRNSGMGEGGLLAQLAGRGMAVCAPDVRGIGDMEPGFSRGAAHYARPHQNEESYAWASLMLGRSLLGQRAADLVAVARALLGAYPEARMVAAARNRLTVPALCAAALEPAITGLYLAGHLSSWRSLLESEDYTEPFVNFIPGVLGHTDLPQIAKSIAPRRVVTAPETAWDPDRLARVFD
jgi:hypothetical protein